MLREKIEKGVNAILLLGFLFLILGIGMWIISISQYFRLSIEGILIIFGCIFLLFGAFAAKVFSRVGN
jgi:hypothetical protein